MSLSASGCGQVESGVCAGEQVDNVACTVDICDGEAKAWAHIPNDDLCEAGQRCDPTAGCVAAGGLTGHAFLFGHTDHSGITVSVDGVEGATATTDAMGNWSMTALPTGTYNITYTKGTYITQQELGVGVLPSAATSPPDVTLHHGSDLGANQDLSIIAFADSLNAPIYSPDRKHIVYRYARYREGAWYRAYKLDGMSSSAVELLQDPTFDPYCYYTCTDGYPFYVSNTHAIWQNNQTVWSRPLDGGPPTILGAVFGGDSIEVMGNPGGPYVVLRKQHYTGVFTESSLYVVKVDGSTPMGTAAWTQPDNNHPLAWVVNNDTTAVFGVNNNTAAPPSDGQASTPIHRIDFATGAMTNVNTGFATNSSGAHSLSPDGKTLYGYLYQPSWYRGFLLTVSGTTGPTLAPNYGAPSGTQYSDYPSGGHQWFADSSGVVLSSGAYTLSAGGTGEGGLKVWHITQPQSTLLVGYGAYYTGMNVPYGWNVRNKTVTFRDTSAATSPFKVVSAHGTSPVIYNLDTSGFNLNDFATYDAPDGMSSYVVWTQSVAAGNGTRAKVFAANLTIPLLAAPGVVQLGGTLANTCQYEAVLSQKTYWQLCQDTGVLSGFAPSTSTAGTQTQMVRAGLIAVPDAERVAFRRYDGKVYSSPNTGAMTDVKLISTTWDGSSPLQTAGKWLVFNDVNGDILRSSNADGSANDEPLSDCTLATFSNNPSWHQVTYDPMKTHFVFGGVKCGANAFGEFQVPAANLP